MPALAVRCLILAVVLTAAGHTGCRSDARRPTPHSVSYRLAWSSEGIVPQAGGKGWEVVNDRGYRVRIERGFLVDYSMELVECPKEARAATQASWWMGWVASPAWGGHAPTTPNPAAIHTPHIEELHAPADFEVGAMELAAQRYCRVHYLIARATRAAVGLPDDVDMVDRSLYVRGTYQAAGAAAPEPFEIATSAANAVLTELYPPGRFGTAGAALIVDTGREHAGVVIRRALRSLFDGVDFAAMPPARIERQVLQNLIDHTDIAVRVTP